MKLLIEDYQYEAKDVVDVLEGLFTLQDIENKISVSYVGYYFNPKVKDCVFIPVSYTHLRAHETSV